MASDIKYLKTVGVSSGDWKKIFSMPLEELKEKNKPAWKLVQLLSERARAAKVNNLADYPAYAAIDMAYQAGFDSASTLVQNIVSRNLNANDTQAALKAYGLSDDELFLEIEKADGTKAKMLNVPILYKVVLPIVRAYHLTRTSKCFNDRNTTPLLNFAPIKNTARDRVTCEVVTDWVENISTNYGYSNVLKEAIHQGGKYGISLSFTKEEWDCQRRVVLEEGEPVKEIEKEGLRYLFPHPSRMFFDLRHPLTTINSDSGVEFTGYYDIRPYGEILDNRMYWNRKNIFFGTNWLDYPGAGNYFKDIFPCVLDFPELKSGARLLREDKAAYYSNAMRDKALFVTHMEAKIIPSNWGLGDYKYPIWAQFELAGDDTVIWAAPRAYTPNWTMPYDYDYHADMQSSIAIEAMPFQNHLGNILTQMYLTVRQNLMSLVWYDEEVVNKSDISKLLNYGEGLYRSTKFVGYSSLKQKAAQADPKSAFTVVNLPFKDINQLMAALNTTLNLMERVLQMSAQEVGAAAQHYQSAQEVGITSAATSNRLAYIGSFIDDGIHAWKKQLYDASQAYGESTIHAQLSADIPNVKEVLADMGFDVTYEDNKHVTAKGKKQALKLASFARADNSSKQSVNEKAAQIWLQALAPIFANPQLLQNESIVEMIELLAKLSGAGNEFKVPRTKGQNPADAMAQMQQMAQGIMQSVQQNVQMPAAKKAAEHEQRIDQMEAVMKQIQQFVATATEAKKQDEARAMETQAEIQRDNAEFVAEEQRKQQAHQLQMQQTGEKAALDLQIKGATGAIAVATKAKMAKAKT